MHRYERRESELETGTAGGFGHTGAGAGQDLPRNLRINPSPAKIVEELVVDDTEPLTNLSSKDVENEQGWKS